MLANSILDTSNGTEFQVARVAPLGDPVEIKIRNFNLSLRKDEAKTLRVEGIKR